MALALLTSWWRDARGAHVSPFPRRLSAFAAHRPTSAEQKLWMLLACRRL